MHTLLSCTPTFRSLAADLVQRILPSVLLIVAGLLSVQRCAGVPFRFEQTGSLYTAHYEHTATLLKSGKVVMIGGNTDPEVASSELYDPVTGTCTHTGASVNGRSRQRGLQRFFTTTSCKTPSFLR